MASENLAPHNPKCATDSAFVIATTLTNIISVTSRLKVCLVGIGIYNLCHSRYLFFNEHGKILYV